LAIEFGLRWRLADRPNDGNRGVVDEDVQSAPLLGDAANQLGCLVQVGLVCADRLSQAALREYRVDYGLGLLMSA
jgi:hypothetical protein